MSETTRAELTAPPERRATAYPYSVIVMGTTLGYRWVCGCGKGKVFGDERQCRDDGAAHQRAHTEAFEASRES